MVEHQNHPKKMENLNIIIEINEEGEMADFDISLRSELPYKNTDEYEYVVEEFEKVKEVNHKKLRCLLARELNCFACTAIYRFQLVFVRRRRKVPANNVQYVVVNQRKQTQQQQQQQQQQQPSIHHQTTTPVTKTVRVIPKVTPPNPVAVAQRKQPMPSSVVHKSDESRLQGRAPGDIQRTVKIGPNKSIAVAQNTVRGRIPSQQVQQQQRHRVIAPQSLVSAEIASSEEDIETEVIDSSMVEVQIESSNSPKPVPQMVKKLQNPPKRSSPMTQTAETTVATSTTTTAAATTTPTPKNIESMGDIDLDGDSLKCDLCDKEFHSARQRQRHRITHFEHSNVINCKKCDKAFLHKAELVAHERTHSKGIGRGGPGTKQQIDTGGGGGGTKRKSDAVNNDEQVLMEMTVTEEEIIEPDGMYVQEV